MKEQHSHIDFDGSAAGEGYPEEKTIIATGAVVDVTDAESHQDAILSLPLYDSYNPMERSCHARTLKILFFIYVVLVILLFVVPRYAVHTGDGLGDISVTLSYVLLFGIVILGVSIASLVVTISAWSRLSLCMHIIGLFPIICSVIIVLVIAFLVSVASSSDTSSVSPSPCFEDDSGNVTCLTPKNYTNNTSG